MEDSYSTPQTQTKSNSLAVPIAIIVGFGMIAAAIYFGGSGGGTAVNIPENTADDTAAQQEPQGSPEAINPVTEDDHIRGNPNAQIMLVEYSDYDCPFCKNFHETMNRIMAEYGADGRIGWVYRHFPLEQLHPNAPRIAQASECVADLGGNEAFWTFSDLVFEERETNAQTNPLMIPNFVEAAGVNVADFDACMESGETTADVEEDYNNAIAIGGRGTPYTVMIVGDQQGVINGAQPYDVVKRMIDDVIGQLDSGGAQ